MEIIPEEKTKINIENNIKTNIDLLLKEEIKYRKKFDLLRKEIENDYNDYLSKFPILKNIQSYHINNLNLVPQMNHYEYSQDEKSYLLDSITGFTNRFSVVKIQFTNNFLSSILRKNNYSINIIENEYIKNYSNDSYKYLEIISTGFPSKAGLKQSYKLFHKHDEKSWKIKYDELYKIKLYIEMILNDYLKENVKGYY
jgi:hypothetical protein